MNNFRLSTYKGTVQVLSLEEINQITMALPTIEYLLDGRVIDRFTKNLLPRLGSPPPESGGYLAHLPPPEGVGQLLVCMKYMMRMEVFFQLTPSHNFTEAASIVGLYPYTLSKYLDVEVLSSEGMFVDIKNNKIRRVRVFIPIKQLFTLFLLFFLSLVPSLSVKRERRSGTPPPYGAIGKIFILNKYRHYIYYNVYPKINELYSYINHSIICTDHISEEKVFSLVRIIEGLVKIIIEQFYTYTQMVKTVKEDMLKDRRQL